MSPHGELNVSRLGLGTMGMSAYYTGVGSDHVESASWLGTTVRFGSTVPPP